MNILYIDREEKISDVRIGEQEIYGSHLPGLGHKVHFLLLTSDCEKEGEFSDNIKVFGRPHWRILKKVVLVDFLAIFVRGLSLNKKYHYDIIIARKNITTGFAALLLCKIYSLPFVYLLSFPKWEAIKEKGKNKTTQILYRFISKIYLNLNICLIRNASLVIPQTKYFWKLISEKYKLEKIKMLPIPMGVNTETLPNYRNQKQKLRAELNLDIKKNILIYFGSMEPQRNLIFIIDFMEQVICFNKNIQFLFIGGYKKQHSLLEQTAKEKKIGEYFLFYPQMKREILYKYIASADLSISPIPPVSSFIISSPTKLIESLGLGIPIIANDEIYEQKYIINQSGGGRVVSYEKNAFSKAILDFITNKKKLEIMGQTGKKYIYKNRDYQKMAKKVEVVFKGMTKRKDV